MKPTPTGQIIVDFMKGRMPAYIETGMNLIDVDDVAQGHLLLGHAEWPPGRTLHSRQYKSFVE